MNQFLGFIKLLILFLLPFNTALAGEIYSTNFDSGTLDKGKSGFTWKSGSYTTVSTDNPKSGTHSLKFKFLAADDPNNPQNNASDAWAEKRYDLGGYYKDIWIKYDLYIPSNFYHRKPPEAPYNTNNKGPVWIWTDDYGQPREGPKLGSHWWAKADGESQVVLFSAASINGDATWPGGKNWNSKGDEAGNNNYAIVESDRGHWMTIVTHFKYASIANNDGVAEMWKTNWKGNTVKLIDVQDGSWYATKADSTEPARGFRNGYLLGWASSGFAEETILYIDNITFSTNPLSADSAAAPKPPTIFGFNQY